MLKNCLISSIKIYQLWKSKFSLCPFSSCAISHFTVYCIKNGRLIIYARLRHVTNVSVFTTQTRARTHTHTRLTYLNYIKLMIWLISVYFRNLIALIGLIDYSDKQWPHQRSQPLNVRVRWIKRVSIYVDLNSRNQKTRTSWIHMGDVIRADHMVPSQFEYSVSSHHWWANSFGCSESQSRC